MINTTAEYKKAMKEGKRALLAKASCLLKNGTMLNFDHTNIMVGGLSITDGVCSSGNFDLGSAIINQLTLKINNMDEEYSSYDFTDAQITVWEGAQLSSGPEWLKKGVFNASDPTETPAVITLKALDNMAKFDSDYDGNMTFPITIQAMVQYCCDRCGVILATQLISNGKYVIHKNPFSDAQITYRTIISHCAVIAGCFARCNADGQLELKWYDKTAFSEASKHHEITQIASGLSVMSVDVTITGIKVTSEGDEKEKETYLSGTEGYVLSVSGNPLIQPGDTKTIASYLAEKIVGMRFRPMKANAVGDPSWEAGDAAVITDRKGKKYNCYLTNIAYAIGQRAAISCDAQPASRKSADRYDKINKVIAEIKKNVQSQLTEYGKYFDQMNSLAINAMGYYETVEIQDDGSKITYMHDKPNLSESKTVYKKSIDGYFWSNDGGKTWTSGIDKNGNAVMNVIAAIGLHAEWIKAGKIQVEDSDGKIIFLVDMDTKKVIISGDSVQIGGRPVQDVINSGISESKNYSDKQLADYANTVTKDLENLQAQVDGQVEDYYYDYEPSMQNIPASQWTTTEERQKHIGDRFFWKSKGYAYRFMENGGVWGWTLLQDTDITKAMQTAQNAKDIADGKRRTFITTPVPPYDIGDLWTNGKDILTCIVSRASGAAYVSSDWEKQNHYTDDTVANQALEEARKAHNLTISLDNDYQGIPADYNGNIADFPTVKTHVTVFYGHDDVSASCTYSVQKSSSVAGTWDNTRREYTVTGLSDDTGWVDITANYMQLFTVTKRFNVAKNKDGAPGANGTSVTIVSKSVTYQVGASGTQKPIGEWEEAIPQVPAGQYLWTKTYVKYSDGNSTESYTVSYKATDGTNGDPGISVTIKSKSVTYQASASGTTPPTGEWKTSVPSVTKGQYLWTRTVVNYSDGTSTTSYSVGYQGTNGADGSPGRTYFMELSSLVVKQSKDNTISPNYITMSAFYRDGTNTARTPYAGRFKIEESTDGNTWKTVYTSSENESSVRHSLYSVLSTQSGGAITTASGRSIGIPRDVIALRCTLYAAGGTTQMLDTQSAAVVLDVDALTHEEIFNLLTKNGEIKGIYQEGNQLYISFTYAKGGALTLGGSGNGNGTLKILNASGAQVGYIDNTGVHFNQGEFAGALKAATGNFSGNLNASVGGTIGGWKINVSNQTLTSPDGNIVLDAKNAKIITSGKNVNGSVKTVISNIQSTFPSVDVIDGTVNVKRSTGGYSFQVDSSSSSQIGFFNPFGDGGSSSPTDRIKVNGNFSATGTKNREVKTQDYDNRLQYCYEMASPMFGDIGEAVTDDSGKCYIYLDDIFLETVNTDIEYQVFLQKEAAGDLWVDQKSREYFVVNGTPELNFAWEIKVKQKDFEFERLNESVELDDEIDRIPYLRQGQTLFEEYSQEQEEGQLLFESYCQEQEAVQ